MRAANFSIDPLGDHIFDGFTSGETWNGWACPYFMFDEAQRIVEAHRAQGGTATYDDTQDAFSFVMGEGEVDTFPAETIQGRRLYPIGTGCWIWEEAADETVAEP